MKREFAFWIVITIFVIVLVLALNQRYGFVERVMFAPTTLPKIGSSGTGASGDCCLCVYDESDDDDLFKLSCQSWLDSQMGCAVKKMVPINTNDAQCWENADCGNAFSPGECSGRELRFLYNGHSSSSSCKPFIDKVFEVCVKADASCIDAVNEGCSTFGNYFDALSHASSLFEETGISARITANQCSSYFDKAGRCLIDSESKCTVEVTASCSSVIFDSCNFGQRCKLGSECESAYCTDSQTNQVIKKECCGVYPTWQPEGACNSICSGACCLSSFKRDPPFWFCIDDSDPVPGLPLKQFCLSEFRDFKAYWHLGETCESVACPSFGVCCLEFSEGPKECRENLSKEACHALYNVPVENKQVVSVSWVPGKEACEYGVCPEVMGACCTINSCTPDNPYTCYDDLSFQQCEAKEAENPLCVRAQWGFEKKCTDMSCAKEGCRVDYPDAYVGDSCDTCKRNFCSLYEIMSGGCYSWCSSYDTPDDFGNYCCGPA